MWIFTLDGFYSVVQDHKDPMIVWVRARAYEDLERLRKKLKVKTKIRKTPDHDYAYRVRMHKKRWRSYVNKAVTDVQYTNFKAAVGKQGKWGKERASLLSAIWSAAVHAFGTGIYSKTGFARFANYDLFEEDVTQTVEDDRPDDSKFWLGDFAELDEDVPISNGD
jgi:hypothetical protein